MSRKTKLDEIAKAACVSLSTVDRVLNRRGGVTPEKEAKVLEWANKLNLDRIMFRDYVRGLRVAVIMQSPRNPFYRGLHDAFTSTNIALAALKITCFVHHTDIADIPATLAQVRKCGRSYDALIVICQDDPRLSDELRLLSEKLPIITLVTDLPDSGRLAYVGPDNRQMGRVAGELMGRFLGREGGDVLVVLGLHRITGHEEREMGFRSVLREHFPACVITGAVESGERQECAGEVVSAALRKTPNIRGIYNISAGNMAIAEVIRSMGVMHKITLITHELTSGRRTMLREGILDVVIDQNPQLEVQRALERLARHFGRSSVQSDAERYTPFNIFIRENCPIVDSR